MCGRCVCVCVGGVCVCVCVCVWVWEECVCACGGMLEPLIGPVHSGEWTLVKCSRLNPN